jgi:hypothetical protein
MAQLPTIASTANRRLLPTADLRVEGATPAAFGAAVGAGLQQLGEAGQGAGAALQQFQQAKQQELDRLAEFDRQTQFVNFGSDQSTKLEEAARGVSGPAVDFTKSRMEQFDTDAQQFLANVPERNRHEWQARMAQLRSGVAGAALKTEFAQRDSYYKTTTGDALGKLLNGAMSSPDKLDAWKAQGEEIINTSGLSPQDKFEYLTRWKGQIGVAAAQGDLQRDPEGALARLGGIGTEIVQVTTGGASSAQPTGNFAKMVGITLSSESGGKRYGPGGGLLTSSAGAKGEMQVLDRTNADPGFGVKPAKDNSPEERARVGREYLAAMLKRYDGDAAKAWAAYNGGPGRVDDAVKARGANWLSAMPGETQSYVAKNVRQLGVAAGSAGPDGTFEARPKGDGSVDPRYADIPIDARIQLIGAAEREIAQRDRQEQAAQQQAHDQWLNQFMVDLNDGKAGAADIEAARKSGHLTDFDEINRAQNIVEARQKANVDINTYNTLVATPGFAWNPYDDRQRKAVDAAVAAQGGTPQAAFDVWQRTGILGKAGGVALRGSMISTDPNQVSAGASIASNMLARNPNAFAGVEGGEEIERNALLYGHYVNDLGYSPQDAAARVAQQNSPEMRRKIQMGQPEVAAFRKEVQKTNVQSVLGRALDTTWFDGRPTFAGPEQRQAAAQDYADLAADHFQRYGDSSAAQAFALAQMKRLYGVVNGQLMKYPPTRAYPAIAGSQSYIFEQAAADIKSVTGRTVDPKNVYLLPVPTATAEAFRAGKAPPYEVHYIDQVGGQNVYRVLNGQAFYADPNAAARAAGTQRKAQLQRERQDYLAREQFGRDATTARFGMLPGVTAPARK